MLTWGVRSLEVADDRPFLDLLSMVGVSGCLWMTFQILKALGHLKLQKASPRPTPRPPVPVRFRGACPRPAAARAAARRGHGGPSRPRRGAPRRRCRSPRFGKTGLLGEFMTTAKIASTGHIVAVACICPKIKFAFIQRAALSRTDKFGQAERTLWLSWGPGQMHSASTGCVSK